MDRRRTLSASRSTGLVLVALAWALFLTLVGSPEALLFTVPVFLLSAPLALGRYIGEETIAAVRLNSRRPRGEAPVLELGTRLVFPKNLSPAFRQPARGPPALAS